tara:strand:+ start:762 stop:896 length:135 start_codon:yes stop_codon:yes gene_type:complete
VTSKKDYQAALKNKRVFDNMTKRYFKIGMRLKQKNERVKHAKKK